MKRAILTGATGFVGHHLAAQLSRTGWEIHAVARPSSDTGRLSELPGTSIHTFDGSGRSIAGAIAGEPSILFHLASLFISEHQHDDVRALVQSNIGFGLELVDALTESGTVSQMVNTGTAWQHFESASYSPVNLYAATKQSFEDLLTYYVEARRLTVITLELTDTFGPGDTRTKLLRLLRRVKPDSMPLQMSPGDQRIDLVHVNDVVSAYRIAADRLLAGQVEGHEKFSVTSGKSLRLRELIDLVEKVADRSIPVVWGGRPYRAREVMEVPVGKRLPDWEPAIDLEAGLREYFSERG